MARDNRIFRFNRALKRIGARWHTLQTMIGTVYVPNEEEGSRLPIKLSHRTKRKVPDARETHR